LLVGNVAVGLCVNFELWWWLTASVIVLFVVETIASLKPYDTVTLKAALESIHENLSFPADANVRCTIHVKSRRLTDRKEVFLKQILNYVPTGGGKGRKFHSAKGIIGKCFRERGICFEVMDENKPDFNFVKKMVSVWGYTEQEAGARDTSRRSYMCLPILDPDEEEVVGVLYFDSRKMDTFSPDIAQNAERFLTMISRLLHLRKDS
jgi:hypothetical protein